MTVSFKQAQGHDFALFQNSYHMQCGFLQAILSNNAHANVQIVCRFDCVPFRPPWVYAKNVWQCRPHSSGSTVTQTVTAPAGMANNSQLNSDSCSTARTATAEEANKFGFDSDSERGVLEVAAMLTTNADIDTDLDTDSDWEAEVDQLEPVSYL